jgi:poly-D-alanine transfer protein DltD
MLDVLGAHVKKLTEVKKCATGTWIDGLQQQEQDAFAQLISAQANAQGLYDDLTKAGNDLPFGMTTFRMHMKGYCTCQKN